MSKAHGTAEVTIEAVITRADGTKENLGVVSRSRVDKSLVSKLFKRHGNRTNKHRKGENDKRP